MFDLICFDLQTLVLIARGEKHDAAVPRQAAMDELYRRFEGLIVKQATGNHNSFVETLGKEDAVQEAGLAFVEAVYSCDVNCPAVIENVNALSGYFKAAIRSRLIDVCRRETCYQKRQPVTFDEPTDDRSDASLDVEDIILHHEALDKNRFYLEILHALLQHPQLLIDKAGLSVYESLVIWKTFVDKFTERKIANGMGVSCSTVHEFKKSALYKLRKYLIQLNK